MTRHFGPNDHDQAAHHWLTQHQHALTHALDDLLDTEAGLREILLHSHHDAATDKLDTVLDTEAGLAAILPAPPTPPADTHDTPPHHTDTMELLRALSPADRMTLRDHPDVKTASQALDRGIRQGGGLSLRGRALTRGLARDLADALDLDLSRALTFALSRARARNLNIDRSPDLALARSLARNLDLTRALTIDIDGGRDRDLDRARDRARNLTRDLDRDLDRALALDRALNHNRNRDRDLYLDLNRTRARNLDRARALDRALTLSLDRDLDRALALDFIVEVRTAEVGRAIGLALRREPLVLDRDSLHALLDDFTAADLSNADLTGIDLSGVHWSEHTTQWPPAINVEDLKTRSDETPPGSGTWIVQSGTATIRDLAER